MSRYYPDEGAAILAAAADTATAKNWPPYLLPAVQPLIDLADTRTGQNGYPDRGAWLAALAALWIADLTEDPAPGWVELGGWIGDAANLALQQNQRASAFATIWDRVKNGFLTAATTTANAAANLAENVAEAAADVGTGAAWVGLLGLLGLGLAAIFAARGGSRG